MVNQVKNEVTLADRIRDFCIIAIGFGLLVYWSPLPVAVLLPIVAAVGAYELASLLVRPRVDGAEFTAMFLTFVMVTCAMFTWFTLTASVVISTGVLAFYWLDTPKEQRGFHKPMWLAILYTCAPFCLVAYIVFEPLSAKEFWSGDLYTYDGAILVGACILAAALGDTMAFVVGKLLGRHIPFKLAPKISPGKTWVGFVGAIVSSVAIGGLWLLPTYFDFDQQFAMVFVGTLVIAGGVGDLFISWLKRRVGEKETGVFFLSHGGVFDRLDGAAPCVVVGVILWYATGGAL